MIKFLADLKNGGTLYGFGLSDANLERLALHDEAIFFDFGYAGIPKLFGLILYFDEFVEPEEISANSDVVGERSIPFFNPRHGVTSDTLRVFPISKRIMQELRAMPFCGLQAQIQITDPNDVQVFFSGGTEQEIEQFFRDKGLINSKTKQIYKGFEKR